MISLSKITASPHTVRSDVTGYEPSFSTSNSLHHRRRSSTKDKKKQQQTKPWKFSDQLSVEGRLAMQLAKEDSYLQSIAEVESDSNNNNVVAQQNSSEVDSVVQNASIGTTSSNRVSSGLQNRIPSSYDSGIHFDESDSKLFSISSARDSRQKQCDNINSVTLNSSNKHSNAFLKSNNNQRNISSGYSVKSSSASCFSDIFARQSSSRMRMDITDASFSWDRERKKPLGGGKLESTLELVEVVNADMPVCKEEEAMQELARINSVDKCMVWMEANGEYQYERDLEDYT